MRLRACEACGKPFPPRTRGTRQRGCSLPCVAELRRRKQRTTPDGGAQARAETSVLATAARMEQAAWRREVRAELGRMCSQRAVELERLRAMVEGLS